MQWIAENSNPRPDLIIELLKNMPREKSQVLQQKIEWKSWHSCSVPARQEIRHHCSNSLKCWALCAMMVDYKNRLGVLLQKHNRSLQWRFLGCPRHRWGARNVLSPLVLQGACCFWRQEVPSRTIQTLAEMLEERVMKFGTSSYVKLIPVDQRLSVYGSRNFREALNWTRQPSWDGIWSAPSLGKFGEVWIFRRMRGQLTVQSLHHLVAVRLLSQ